METLVNLLLAWWDTVKLFELVPPDERAVVVTFGRLASARDAGHGLVWKWPVIQSVSTINVTPQIVDLRAQSVTTHDHQSIAVSGAIEYEVRDPVRAIYGVYDFNANIQAGALGVISHYINGADHWEDADALAKEITKEMRELARECGIRLRHVWITDLSRHRAIRLMGIEPHKAGDK